MHELAIDIDFLEFVNWNHQEFCRLHGEVFKEVLLANVEVDLLVSQLGSLHNQVHVTVSDLLPFTPWVLELKNCDHWAINI